MTEYCKDKHGPLGDAKGRSAQDKAMEKAAPLFAEFEARMKKHDMLADPRSFAAGYQAKEKESPLGQPMETAPKDGTHIIVLTCGGMGWVEAWWCKDTPDFYRSNPDFNSFKQDIEKQKGTWVAYAQFGDDNEQRLYCGSSPEMWVPLPNPPKDK